jgi:hypothetical protein
MRAAQVYSDRPDVVMAQDTAGAEMLTGVHPVDGPEHPTIG